VIVVSSRAGNRLRDAYEQLAAAYRRIGNDAGARTVQLAKHFGAAVGRHIHTEPWNELGDRCRAVASFTVGLLPLPDCPRWPEPVKRGRDGWVTRAGPHPDLPG
jgi:hypothetical protein